MDYASSSSSQPIQHASTARQRFAWMAAACLLLIAAVSAGRFLRNWQAESSSSTPPSTADSASAESRVLARGQVVYTTYCAKCHGPEGHGDGDAVVNQSLRPRDFSADQWRFPKTEESIARVVREGIPGTSMPGSQKALTTGDIAAVAAFVLALADRETPIASAIAPQRPLAIALKRAGFRAVTRQAAPAVELTQTATGDSLALADLRGQTVLLHFWGTTCAHCLSELPRLAGLKAGLQESPFAILSICVDETDIATAEMIGRPHAGQHPLYVDESGLAVHQFDAHVLPTYVVINSQGQIIGRRQGVLDATAADMLRLMQTLDETEISPPRGD